MCGIAGIYKTDGRITEGDKGAVHTMMDALHHRGPDDEGFYYSGPVALGHKRLSIIDLNGGHQPMTSNDGSLCIVLNGEIYNYVELKNELIGRGVRFKTDSDTEVLLKLYEFYGESCIDKLNGMFAFAIWNEKDRSLFLCRDRLGIKPLYYHYDGKQFTFSSEIKAFSSAHIVKPELNRAVLEDYIILQMSISDETFFKGVKKISPGTFLVINRDGIRTKQYWSLDFTIDPAVEHDENRYIDELHNLLKDVMRLQVRSDVPVGAHLSGGLDSSAVCCLASTNLGKALNTFTGYFEEGGVYDEREYAREVVEFLGVNGRFKPIAWKNAAEGLQNLMYFMDEPQVGPGLIPQYEVSKLAKDHVKVVLSGLGGDETFGGYARYYLAYLEECLKGAIDETQQGKDNRFVVSFESLLPNLPLLKDYVPLMKSFWSDGLFEDPARRYFELMRRDKGMNYFCAEIYNDNTVNNVEERFLNTFNSSGTKSLLNRMLAFDLKIFIPALLHVEDRTSMAVSLESRVPLLDHRVVELAAKMPPTIKWKGGRPKHIFREAVKDLVPTKVGNRKDKRGFPTPIAEWFSGPLKGYVHEIMTSSAASSRGLYNFTEKSKKMNSPLEKESCGECTSGRFDRSLWGTLCVELWHRQFIDR